MELLTISIYNSGIICFADVIRLQFHNAAQTDNNIISINRILYIEFQEREREEKPTQTRKKPDTNTQKNTSSNQIYLMHILFIVDYCTAEI